MGDSVNRMHRVRLLAGLVLAVASVCALGPGSAEGFSGINEYNMRFSSYQAGGHPDVDIDLNMDSRNSQGGVGTPPLPGTCGCDDPEGIDIHFPTGFIGSPTAIPKCSLADFSTGNCPVNAQVGEVDLGFIGRKPMYNMETRPGEAALTAFEVPATNSAAFTILHGRTGSDYGLDATTTGIFHILPLGILHIHLWGVPALPVHDVNRWPQQTGFCVQNEYPHPCFAPTASNSPPAPYLEAPTTCGTPLTAAVNVHYYDFTNVRAETSVPGTVGCDQLTFNPSLTALPTTGEADSASGMDVDVKVPQTPDPSVPSSSEIEGTTVHLPEGFSINPNAADGKTSCTDEEAGFGTEAGADCPEYAKVGTDVIDSSALPGPISGAIYLGAPQPGNRYRIFLTADGFGTHVKLAGSARPDPGTGRLTISFENLPQSPFRDFSMHFFGSERGLLATPTQCGTYPVNTDFTPWDNELSTQHSLSYFTVDSGPNSSSCPSTPRRFEPAFLAGTVDNTAGVHTPFTFQVKRADGDQNFEAINVTTPPGFTATLKGIPYCPQAALDELQDPSYTGLDELSQSSCPAASEVGTAVTGVGAGTHPLYTPGKVFLAGPYRGAPLSLAIVVPAVSGPYDLGNVAVRVAIRVNPVTAQITAVSDEIPHILDGIPLRLRSIQVKLDRKQFGLNPTNCDPFSVETSLAGNEGAVATPSAAFQVANCTDLAFGPKLGLHFSGATKRRGHPDLRAVLRAQPGEANISKVVTTLPSTELLDNAHIQSPCTGVQYAQDACPAGSRIGSVTAESPLLGQALSGPVYLRSGKHKLPDLVAQLNGQVDIELVGRIDSPKGAGLRTSFETVPDVPVTRFVLSLEGGKKGLLQSSADLCKSPGSVTVQMTGQNGAVANSKRKPQVSCGSSASRKRHERRAR
jgi:hypothetical protein